MVQPVAFGYNAQTAVNNYFQQQGTGYDAARVQAAALGEFNEMVEKLRAKGVEVIVIADTTEPHTPDSIFPNNIISFHQEGHVAIYPMYAPNRQAEHGKDPLSQLRKAGVEVCNVMDYSGYEQKQRYLEGTGSMVLDRANRIAYAALSERTDEGLLNKFCTDFNYTPHPFTACQTVNGARLPIYHTNVMMCVADRYAVLCAHALDNANERKRLILTLERTGKQIVEITEEQMHAFAGNMLQVSNKEGERMLVMSATARNSLTESQLKQLTSYNEIIAVSIHTIEKYGGGSARCMMAEVKF